MVTLVLEDADIRDFGKFSEEEIVQIQEQFRRKVEELIENERHPSDFEVVKYEGIVDKEIHKAEVGESIVFWPSTIEDAVDFVDGVDDEKLRQYFNSGRGIGFSIEHS